MSRIDYIRNWEYSTWNYEKVYPIIVLRNVYLRISAQSTTKSMYTHWNLAVLCTSEFDTHLFIVSQKTYDVISDVT